VLWRAGVFWRPGGTLWRGELWRAGVFGRADGTLWSAVFGRTACLRAISRFSRRRRRDRQDGPESKEEEQRPSRSTLKGRSLLRAPANSDRAHVTYLCPEYPPK
jgi:hypothetical protein